MPSRWSVGEGHVGIKVLEHIDVGVPGVGEDGMPGRNEQRKPGTTRGSPRRSRTAKASRISRHAVEYSTYPRGPRSGPGCSVPVRHHLFGPIRPTRRHIAISPHCDLYAMPSLCGSA